MLIFVAQQEKSFNLLGSAALCWLILGYSFVDFLFKNKYIQPLICRFGQK